ncbi:hypothetical protein T310_1149 [Rasamsonia emersonii CBS 393.64]|uniref:Major facilitator superfamily (MFS) profile domain-containing protein n=1 Tax=Rasamsonia emersonii (strain ATCC 16479 / CBS 393.64 / IMI 116815) TaxID=1408163 RepID=A0A0F4Z377_RASE3|nr:hypothetical protein T310_1149 [Rasamsonia emersonii CBS 393.64]KKA24790.1 hypothetical protein T310_1149 [Rasamsonia emersonii CBS 393.64]
MADSTKILSLREEETKTTHFRENPSIEHGIADELRVRTKTDLSVLLLLFLGLTVFQLDRMNIGSTLTGGFAADIGVDQNTINLGNQLMFLGIVVLEIPSNMLLQRIGPSKWISAQVFIFGLVATLQIFITSRAGFLVTRSILGLAEAGYIPGGIYTLSTWYPRHELATRVAVFFFGMFGGNAISPLLGAGILKLDGRVEGIWTIAVSVLLFLALPASPDNPRPLFFPGLIRFSEEEQSILRVRLGRDNHEKKNKIPLRVVWRTLANYRRWLHYLATACVFSTWSPLTTYTPSIMLTFVNDEQQSKLTAPQIPRLRQSPRQRRRRHRRLFGPSSSALLRLAERPHRTTRSGRRPGHPVLPGRADRRADGAEPRSAAESMAPRRPLDGRQRVCGGISSCAQYLGAGQLLRADGEEYCDCVVANSIILGYAYARVMSAIAGLMAGTQIFRAGDGPLYCCQIANNVVYFEATPMASSS